MAPRLNPLSGVVMPQLPTLTSEKTKAPLSKTEGTNITKAPARSTTNASEIAGTNSFVAKSTNDAQTNLAPPAPPVQSAALVKTNSIGSANTLAPTNSTNVVMTTKPAVTNDSNSTKMAASFAGANATTNIAKVNGKRNGSGTRTRMGMMMGMNGPAAPAPELPAEIKARLNKIYDSEILAQAMHPLPMALQGIAGDVAFLRTASGQTGLVKEGDTLGDLKLLRIGINRVLVEQNGQKKELTMFDGYGSTSLMPEEGKVHK
ncbi:MAG TPA: hypothetical protein VFB72_19220 [Verrucomicrobiae bacterium]|nr:hypothetical protein [Verrucomicrobiae bacterium]